MRFDQAWCWGLGMTLRIFARPNLVAALAWGLCLAIGPSTTFAQPGATPADCKASTGETPLTLDSRKKEIERKLAGLPGSHG